MKRYDETLIVPIEHLERAMAAPVPGKERDWAEGVVGALEETVQALRRHAAATDMPGGMYSKVDLTRPTLARQVGGLRQEHSDFLGQAVSLQAELRGTAETFRPAREAGVPNGALPAPSGARGVPDFGALRAKADELLKSLRRHRDDEAALVIESVTTDLGAGD